MRYRLIVKINPQASAMQSVTVLLEPITHYHHNVRSVLEMTLTMRNYDSLFKFIQCFFMLWFVIVFS